MSTQLSLSRDNFHYKHNTPQGIFLRSILKRTGPLHNVWYTDTMNMPSISHLKKWYKGTVIVYCWWDPARDIITKFLDDSDLNFIIITSDVRYAGTHEKQHVIGWEKQYGLHYDLIESSRPASFTVGKKFLCMMRNHKSERIQFLQSLWKQNKLENLISYLGQINTENNGRIARTVDQIIKPQRFIDSEFTHTLEPKFIDWCTNNLPLQLYEDITQSIERNTDFYTIGNINWYDQTDYSVILETYWAKTVFITEKSFKPIIAQHPFINLGNNTTKLLKKLGFDVFDDVLNLEYDSMPSNEKINFVSNMLPVKFDIDPIRLKQNLSLFKDLRQQSIDEQSLLIDSLEDSLTNFRA